MFALPEHLFQPRRVMWGQKAPVGLGEKGLTAGVHRHGAPRQNEVRLGLTALAAVDQRLGMGQHAAWGLRGHGREEIQYLALTLFDDRRFALPAQIRLTGPVGSAVQEIARVGIGAAPGAQPVPFDHIGGDLPVTGGQRRSRVPIAAAHRIHRPAQRPRALRFRRHGQDKNTHEDRHQARHRLHFPRLRG